NGQDRQNVSVYRSLTAVWIIFALAWIALLLNMGAKIIEHFLDLKKLAAGGDEARPSARKQEEGLSQRAIQQRT
ncbi:hypothetical protein SRHO_G00138360, partial [Serrasalmus rhombeus]